MSKAACLHVGIDIEGWLQQDLLDVLTTGGGYVPFTMTTCEVVALGHAYDVPVYPTISASGMRGADGRYNSIECWRGAASNIWHNGADGIVGLFHASPRVQSTNLEVHALRYVPERYPVALVSVGLGGRRVAVKCRPGRQRQVTPCSDEVVRVAGYQIAPRRYAMVGH